MTRATRWLAVVAVATMLGPGSAWAADIILQNGQRAIIDDNHRLFLVGKDGKRMPARDGTYKTKDGGAIILQHGVVVEGGLTSGGEKGGIILQQPSGQKGAVR